MTQAAFARSTIVLSHRLSERRAHAHDDSFQLASPHTGFEPGTRVDRYLILNRLGGGSMGQVYRARDSELDREVALKVLARPYCRQPEAVGRFRNEAQAQARLRSPHVVTLYSLLELPIASVLVLEYVEGETLEHQLRTGGPLAAADAIAIFEQALLGLAHIHEMGVVHRDLKPSNLFLGASGQVKIMDFSVAKLSRDAYPPGTMVGTLLYISPEQISGRHTDVRSDIYALGMSLYETVTGRLPFQRRTDYELMHAQVQEQPQRPCELERSIPAALERVILKSIEKDPDRRYRSAAEFRAALLKLGLTKGRDLTTALPANAYGPPPQPSAARRSGRRVLGGFSLDLLLVAAVCSLLYSLGLYPGRTATAPQVAAAAPTTAVKTPSARPAAVRVKQAQPMPETRAPARVLTPTPRNEPTPVPTPARESYGSPKSEWGF